MQKETNRHTRCVRAWVVGRFARSAPITKNKDEKKEARGQGVRGRETKENDMRSVYQFDKLGNRKR